MSQFGPSKFSDRSKESAGEELAALGFTQADLNGDARIDGREFGALGIRLIRSVDANRDGAISRTELARAIGKTAKREGVFKNAARSFTPDVLIRLMDVNRNGRIDGGDIEITASQMGEVTLSQLVNAIPVALPSRKTEKSVLDRLKDRIIVIAAELFNRLDRNHDGQLDKRDVDLNHDGRISDSEASRSRKAIQMLDRLADMNHDGCVSPEEKEAVIRTAQQIERRESHDSNGIKLSPDAIQTVRDDGRRLSAHGTRHWPDHEVAIQAKHIRSPVSSTTKLELK